MSHVHYKFQSSNDHDTITFDGLSISLSDLRASIFTKSKLAPSTDFSLQITNAQTKEVYKNDTDLVPKNTSVTVTRVPVAKVYKGSEDGVNMNEDSHLAFLAKRAESTVSMAEQESIHAMMAESTNDYGIQNYTVRPRFMPRAGQPNATYLCRRCNKPGHFLSNCPLNAGPMVPTARFSLRTTNPLVRGHGIPADFLEPADANTPGAFLSKYGYVINKKDAIAYEEASKKRKNQLAPHQLPEFEIPEQFICPLCKEIMTDAVKTSCCVTHFCDSCIREALLDDEDQSCPQCNEVESPDGLAPDIILRNAISTFLNKTKSGFRRTMKAKKPTGAASPAQTAASTSSPSHPASALSLPSRNTPERSATPTNKPTTTTATSDSAQEATPVSENSVTPAAAIPTTATTESASSADAVSKPTDTNVPSTSAATVTPAAADAVSSTSLGEAAPGTVPVTIVPSSSTSSVSSTPASATSQTLLTSSALPTHPAALGVTVAVGYPTAPVLYNVAGGAFAPTNYAPVVAAAVAPSYTQFPPGMRPGLTTGFGAASVPHVQVGQPLQVMSKEQFYKTKAELLELQINEAKTKPKDKMMDAFGELLRPRNRSRSRSPRPRSRSRSRHRRSRSRSPFTRRRSISPKLYYGSPRRRSPGYRYPSRSPPPRDYRRPYPNDYYKADPYYKPRCEDSYRDERYPERFYYNGDRLSPYDRNLRCTPPRSYSPDRRDYLSPHSRAYSPRRDERFHEERRRYEDERLRYEEKRRDYREDDRRYIEEEDERRHRYEREEEYSRKNSKYDDRYDSRHVKESHKSKRAEDESSHGKKSSKRESSGDPEERRRRSHSTGKEETKKDKGKERKHKRKSQTPVSSEERKRKSRSPASDDERKVKKKSESPTADDERKVKKRSGSPAADEERKVKKRSKSPTADDERKVKKRSEPPAADEEKIADIKESKSEKEPVKKKAKKTEDTGKSSKSTGEDVDAESKKPSKTSKSKSKTSKSGSKKSSSTKTSHKKSSSTKSSDKKKRKVTSDSAKDDVELGVERKSKADKDVEPRKSTSNKSLKGSTTSTSNTSQTQKSSASNTSQTQKSGAFSQESSSPPLEDLTGDDGEGDSTQPEDGDDLQVIKAPKPSKWEKDDSESDSKLGSPTVKKSGETTKPLSRKVLESADSVLRNKRVKPMGSVDTISGEGQKRKVTLSSDAVDTDTQTEQGNESDASDGKSDLRNKIKRIKERKYSSDAVSSSEKKRDSSSYGKLKSDASTLKDTKTSSKSGTSKSSSNRDSSRKYDKRETEEKSEYTKKSEKNKTEKSGDRDRSAESHGDDRPSSRKSDVRSESGRSSKNDSKSRPKTGKSSSSKSSQESNSSRNTELDKQEDKIDNVANDAAESKPKEVKSSKFESQNSEEAFEPDYDIDISEAQTGAHNLADNDSQSQDAGSSASAAESDSEDKIKKRKRKHSKSKHKKSKKNVKSKHKKHKSDK